MEQAVSTNASMAMRAKDKAAFNTNVTSLDGQVGIFLSISQITITREAIGHSQNNNVTRLYAPISNDALISISVA